MNLFYDCHEMIMYNHNLIILVMRVDNGCYEVKVVVVALGFTRLHHRSWYVDRGVVTPSSIVTGVERELL